LDYQIVAILVDMVLINPVEPVNYLLLAGAVASRGTHHVPAHLFLKSG